MSIRWAYEIGELTVASPILANGVVYVATGGGSVVAFDERTGTPLWRNQLDGPITMTPMVDNGIVFVGTHQVGTRLPSRLYAFDARSGVTRWQATFPGALRSNPVVVNGVLVIGESGGDPPQCVQGGVYAYQAMTGTLLWSWLVDSKPNDGGSVWAPISFGGNDFVVGTGNTCSRGVSNANSIVRLTLEGKQEWNVAQQVNSDADDDWGGSPLLLNNRVYVVNKAGYFYAVDGHSGLILWKTQLTPREGTSYGNPATNGSVLVVSTGTLVSPTSGPASAALEGFDLAGNRLWSVSTQNYVAGGAAITNDVAFAGLDFRLAALQVGTGKELWSYPSPAGYYFYASPAIDSSGVYAVDESGGVFALSLGSPAVAAASQRAESTIRTWHGPVREPFGPVLKPHGSGARLPGS